MKKCPKCGTILDDSKKTCYMCGTVLQKSNITNFGESFNEQIGATISSSQDNAFNDTKNPFGSNIDNVGAVNAANNEIRDIKNSNSDSMYSNQINSLNSLEYDSNKSAIEKLFEDDSRFKKNNTNTFDFDEMINSSNNANSNNTNYNMPINTYNDNDSYDEMLKESTGDYSNNDNKQNNNQMYGSNNNTNYGKVKKDKKSINWGSNLTGSKKSSSNLVIGKISPSLIFNTICFIVFIGLMCFVYFKYIRSDNTYKVSDFGGLYYSIDKSFKLETDDPSRKIYSRGDSCSININYGTTTDVEGYVSEYFDELTKQYKDKEMHTAVQEVTIGTNKWQELTVVDFKENPTSSNGEYSTLEKYKYISIVYKGNYYTVIYANLSLDNDCSMYYNKFRETLAFK
jgi:hypothetical protein